MNRLLIVAALESISELGLTNEPATVRLLSSISGSSLEPVVIKASEPVTTLVPRHKHTHPADIQDRRRRRK